MKNNVSRLILVCFDLVAIILAIIFAFYTRELLSGVIAVPFSKSLDDFLSLYMLYISIIGILTYEGVYTKRFDFWHESKQIIKALFLAFLVVLAYLAITKSVEDVSRFVIIFTFIYAAFTLPFIKFFVKRTLGKNGLWQRKAKVYGSDEFIENEIFSNKYLGYVKSNGSNAKTVFINAQNIPAEKLSSIINKEIKTTHEVIFIPWMKEYELSNTRTNLIQIKNRLKSKYRVFLQTFFNYLLAICILPILLPIIGILAYLIKKESPGPVFFAHNRIGKNGKVIPTLKFRSMYSDAKERLEKLLEEDDDVRKEWQTNFKLKDDPRVTKLGKIMRKTSLDELPQIFNVLKGEMNFVGPRPVIQQEIEQYYKEDSDYYFMVKPGITGLWQVSGRSDTDYDFRISTDKWYVTNWSLWLDVVILFKTVKVVLFREGAY